MSWLANLFGSKNTRTTNRRAMTSTHEAFSLPTSSPSQSAHPDAFDGRAIAAGQYTPSTAYSYPPSSPSGPYYDVPSSYVSPFSLGNTSSITVMLTEDAMLSALLAQNRRRFYPCTILSQGLDTHTPRSRAPGTVSASGSRTSTPNWAIPSTTASSHKTSRRSRWRSGSRYLRPCGSRICAWTARSRSRRPDAQ